MDAVFIYFYDINHPHKNMLAETTSKTKNTNKILYRTIGLLTNKNDNTINIGNADTMYLGMEDNVPERVGRSKTNAE